MLNQSQQEQVNKIVEESLPAQVGEALKKQLARLEELEEENIILKDKIAALEAVLTGKKKEIDNLNEKLIDQDKFADLKIKFNEEKEALRIEKSNLDITVLKIRLEESEKRANHASTINNQLVRNTEYRRDIFKSQQISASRDYTYYPDGHIKSDKAVVEGNTKSDTTKAQ